MIYLFNKSKRLQGMIPDNNFIDANQTVELNGLYLVNVELPLFYWSNQGQFYNHKKKFDDATFIGHFDQNNLFQLYKIHSRKVENENLLVEGIHIFFDEAKASEVIRDRRFIDSEVKPAVDAAFNPIGWYVKDYDVTERLDCNFYYETPVEARKKIIETWNVEIDYGLNFDGKKIISKDLYVKTKLGKWTGKRFNYGTNLLSISQEQSEAEVVTAVIGRGRGEESGDGYGRRIGFADISWSKDGITKPAGQDYIEIPAATAEYGYVEPDGTVKPRIGVAIFEDIEDKTLLAHSTYNYVIQNCVPKVAYKTTIANTGHLNLGDEVGILYKQVDIVKSARVQKLEINLLDYNLTKVDLGDYQHFKQDKAKLNLNKKINRVEYDSRSIITQMKEDFDVRYDAQVEAIDNAYQQAVIDANANIQAAEVRMRTDFDAEWNQMTVDINTAKQNAIDAANQNLQQTTVEINNTISTTRTEMESDYNMKVQGAKDYADTQAQAKADAVQTNLNAFETEHQQLYDSVTSDIMDIDTFLGDKTQTLAQQFADVESDFESLRSDLGDVSGDLSTARTELQQQLDDAKASIEGIEVGGRNLFSAQEYVKDNSYSYGVADNGALIITRVDGVGESSYEKISNLKPDTNYILHFSVAMHDRFTLLDSEGNEVSFINGMWSDDNKVLRFKAPPESVSLNGKFYPLTGYETDFPVEVEVQLEEGTMSTSWERPLEETEAKISTLNQQIDFVEGKLSAKLEQTDLLPLNNKITEYGNTLTANAQSIQSLLDKTELHDGDITKWSAETTANAESITTALSRISKTESGLSSAQTDIGINADGISGLVTELSTVDGKLSSLTTEFNVEAGRIDALVAETGDQGDKLAQLVIDVGGIETTVARHNEDNLQEFTNIDQRFDSITNTVANIDTWQYNLLRGSRFDEPSQIKYWNGSIKTDEDVPYYEYDATPYQGWIEFTEEIQFEAGQQYTLSFDAQTLGVKKMDYTYIIASPDDAVGTNIPIHFEAIQDDGTNNNIFLYAQYRRYWIKFTPDRDILGMIRIGANLVNNERGYQPFKIRLPYLTTTGRTRWLFHQLDNSQNMSEVVSRVSTVEQLAESIRLDVQEISGEYVKQSGVYVGTSGVQIGSTYLGDSEFASIFKVSPRTIDVVTEEMRITADLAVAGDIEALAVSAVTADFASIFANTADIDFIKGKHIDVNTITVDHLYGADAILNYLMARQIFADEVTAVSLSAIEANFGRVQTAILKSGVITTDMLGAGVVDATKLLVDDALINKLVARTLFSNEIKAMSIDAVYADIRSLTSEIFTSNIIKSNWLDVDTALFDRLTADEAFIDRLTVKAANVRDLEAITIDAVQANLTTVMNSMGEVKGGLSIMRPDGVLYINQGIPEFGVPVFFKPFMSATGTVTFDGMNYNTSMSGTQAFEVGYTEHAGRWLSIAFSASLRYNASDTSTYMGVVVRFINKPSGTTIHDVIKDDVLVFRDHPATEFQIDVPLGRPTYGGLAVQLEFYRIGGTSANTVQIRTGRAWING
ncbi:phage tail spike protein [Salinicoccus sp. HZC-1]|uniref:phage tail spike protein n=1 Tax=Salinicoccus sp. HZC-1 TaxID=3385497 RepID=UPI00398B87DA